MIGNFTKFLVLQFSLVFLSYSQWISSYEGNGNMEISMPSMTKGKSIAGDNNGKSIAVGTIYNGVENLLDILVIKYKQNGEVEWSKTYSGTDGKDDAPNDISLDADGNIYITGYVKNNSHDLILLKYSPEGNLLWSSVYNGNGRSSDDFGQALSIDSSGNIYITGYSSNSFTSYIITVKFSPAGEIIWANKNSGPANMESKGFGIAVDNADNIVITGYTTIPGNQQDITLIKYNSSGQQLWQKNINRVNGGEDKAWGIVTDVSDNIYITGYVTSTANNTDIYTGKFSSAGSLLWNRTYDGETHQSDKAWGIVVDTDNRVYITGYKAITTKNTDYITICYDASGTQKWLNVYDGPSNRVDQAAAITLCSVGNDKYVAVTGCSMGNNNNYDFATIIYKTSDGQQASINRYALNSGSMDIPSDVYSAQNRIYVTGYSQYENNSFLTTLCIKLNGTEGHTDSMPGGELPKGFALYQNYPNPFNPSTTIKFDLSANAKVQLVIYDILGKTIDVLVNQEMTAGSYNITYTNKNLSSGIYFYELRAGDFRTIRKMSLIK